MNSFAELYQSNRKPRSVFKALRNTPLVLPEADYQKLQQHLDDCEGAVRPDATLLTYVLANKLMNTRPTMDVNCADLVVGGSSVTYRIDRGVNETAVLLHSSEATTKERVIPVATLLGATLIGMRVGQRAPLLHEDGTIGRLSVTAVTQPL